MVGEGVVAACEVANESYDSEAHSRLAVAPSENIRQSAAARRHEREIIDDVGLWPILIMTSKRQPPSTSLSISG